MPGRRERPGTSTSARETAALQQRLDLGIPAPEIPVGGERVAGTTDPQQLLAEPVAVLAREVAVLAEPLHGVGVEYLAPDVRVLPGAVTAREHVGEVRRGVAGGDGGVVEPDVREGRRLEGRDVDVGRRLLDGEAVPRLVDP